MAIVLIARRRRSEGRRPDVFRAATVRERVRQMVVERRINVDWKVRQAWLAAKVRKWQPKLPAATAGLLG